LSTTGAQGNPPADPHERDLSTSRGRVWRSRQFGITVDPDIVCLAANVRRLESDQIRDAMLQASGELDLKAGGASVEASNRAGRFIPKCLRNSHDPMLDAFDPADSYTAPPAKRDDNADAIAGDDNGIRLQRAQAVRAACKIRNQEPERLRDRRISLV